MMETQEMFEDILINEKGMNTCELDINIFSIYNPNGYDAGIDIDLRLGEIIVLYEPITVNKIVKFFRDVRSKALKDIESFLVALMNNEQLSQQDVLIERKKIL